LALSAFDPSPQPPRASTPRGEEAQPAARVELNAVKPELCHAEFERVYAEQFSFVWRSLLRLGVSQSAIDDAVQDVFIVALRRASDYSGRSSYRTWLFGIAANIARDYRRKWQRAAQHQVLDEQLPALEANPHERLDQRRALRLVESFLDTLDADRREVFVLIELEQLPAPEASSVLAVKLNTVYSRLRSAREAFARFLYVASAKDAP